VETARLRSDRGSPAGAARPKTPALLLYAGVFERRAFAPVEAYERSRAIDGRELKTEGAAFFGAALPCPMRLGAEGSAAPKMPATEAPCFSFRARRARGDRAGSASKILGLRGAAGGRDARFSAPYGLPARQRLRVGDRGDVGGPGRVARDLSFCAARAPNKTLGHVGRSWADRRREPLSL